MQDRKGQRRPLICESARLLFAFIPQMNLTSLLGL